MPKAEHDSPQREVSYKVQYTQLKKHFERLQEQRAQLMAAITEQEQEVKQLRKEKGEWLDLCVSIMKPVNDSTDDDVTEPPLKRRKLEGSDGAITQ
ncbi:hypothetical protein HK097_006414 [Rhizophlyctis rosea]|uniref:Uncharacterized protein n=1 Tax=Rhizophlyctis rosea TaxID=64517 RepID=A0AAD5SM20_9FUNG|nr:hypothetical protein HK097_006414 [Rhizophlyctis rosea]